MISRESVKRFCRDELYLIENYAEAVADATQTWDCHHRLELQDGKILTRAELKAQGLYWHRPAEELVFLTQAEHLRLHNTGKHHSEEARRKMSEALRGKYRGERASCFGTHWWNDGVKAVLAKECPGDGWVRGCLRRTES